MPQHECRTLIVGGNYIESDGVAYANERWLRMVEIFSDNIARPVFALNQIESNDRVMHSAPFRYDVFPVNPPKKRKPWEAANPWVDWHKEWHRRILEDVDAVYCRFPSCYWEGYHIYKLALAQGKLVFASFHGDWAGVYEHLAANASAPKSFAYSSAASAAHRALGRVAETSRVLFCVGSDLERKYGEKARRSVVFANYLHNESDLYRREDTCSQEPFRIVYVGALSPRKGVTYLLAAVAKLRSSGFPVVLSLVGTGEETDALQALGESLGIAQHLEWHGYVPFGQGVFEKYRESDVFVLPAIAGEGLPKVVVEAMSQGLPVVATDVGSTERIMRDSGGGLLVPPRDETALFDALTRILQDGDLRRRSIRNGLAFAARMTNERQRRIITEALAQDLPEVMCMPE